MARPQALSHALKRLRSLPVSTRELCSAPAQEPSAALSPSKSVDSLFSMRSRRRVFGSPILPLESVAMSNSIQVAISRLLSLSKLTPRHFRKSAIPLDRVVAREAAHERRKPAGGAPVVAPPSAYDEKAALVQAVARAPGTLAANVYVMAEARRCLGEGFKPESILDFGAGVGVGTMAAARVFSEEPFENLGLYLRAYDAGGEEREADNAGGAEGESDEEESLELGQSFIREAALVDHSSAMRNMSSEILKADGYIGDRWQLSHAAELREASRASDSWDVVVASYVLNEVVREAMADPAKTGEVEEVKAVARDDRVKLAEKRLRRKVKDLWARTKEGGIFIIVEDGTAAGFETVVYARDVVLKLAERPKEGEEGIEDGGERVGKAAAGAHVIAPCMHSKTCPLEGNITNHRVCRFQQRFNRPGFLRRYRPSSTGYEDEYFSYIVIQKTSGESRSLRQEGEEASEDPWGRLIRAPLMKGKHVVLDACTVEGKLERRVVSKKNAPPGQYPRARRAKWGDIWPVKPTSKPQPLNF